MTEHKSTEELRKEFEKKFTYVEQTVDPLTNNVYRHREFNPNNLITIVDDVWNFFLPHLNSRNLLERFVKWFCKNDKYWGPNYQTDQMNMETAIDEFIESEGK